MFFLDLGYDGLRGTADAVDVFYEGPTKQILFDGQPEKHKLTKGVYEKKLRGRRRRHTVVCWMC